MTGQVPEAPSALKGRPFRAQGVPFEVLEFRVLVLGFRS